jgi:hypothetical protein
MRVLCPRCNQSILLDYLEKKGDQMGYCGKCKILVGATFKKDAERLYWELYFEKSLTKKRPGPRGCWEPILVIVFLVLIILALRNCETRDPKQPPGETPVEQFQN